MNDFVMRRAVVETVGTKRVVALDTIAHVSPEDEGQVVMTGSHGGLSSGEYAGRVALAAVFFNDAGIGKDSAGIAALPYLEGLGIAAGAVSHESAEIGSAEDTWNGLISSVNQAAEAAGFVVGESVRSAVARVYGGSR